MARSIPTPKAVPYAKRTFAQQVNVWLIKWSYRALRSGLPLTHDVLEEYCWNKVARYVVSDYDHFTGGGINKGLGSRVTESQATNIIESVVQFVLNNYDPAEFSQIQRTRGLKSRRFHVADLAKHAHLSIKKAAEAIGCSPSTVSRLRRMIKASAIGRLTEMLRQAKPVEPHIPWGIYELAGLQMSPLDAMLDFDNPYSEYWRTP